MNNPEEFYLDTHMVKVEVAGYVSYYKGNDSYTQDINEASKDLTMMAANFIKAQFVPGMATIVTTSTNGEPVLQEQE